MAQLAPSPYTSKEYFTPIKLGLRQIHMSNIIFSLENDCFPKGSRKKSIFLVVGPLRVGGGVKGRTPKKK